MAPRRVGKEAMAAADAAAPTEKQPIPGRDSIFWSLRNFSLSAALGEFRGFTALSGELLWVRCVQANLGSSCNTLNLEYIFFYGFRRFDLIRVILCTFLSPFDLNFLHVTLHSV